MEVNTRRSERTYLILQRSSSMRSRTRHRVFFQRDTLCVKDRDDPLTETIAKQIIKIAQVGVHDAAQLSALAIVELRIR